MTCPVPEPSADTVPKFTDARDGLEVVQRAGFVTSRSLPSDMAATAFKGELCPLSRTKTEGVTVKALAVASVTTTAVDAAPIPSREASILGNTRMTRGGSTLGRYFDHVRIAACPERGRRDVRAGSVRPKYGHRKAHPFPWR